MTGLLLAWIQKLAVDIQWRIKGASGKRTSQSNFFHFHTVFGKKKPNNRLGSICNSGYTVLSFSAIFDDLVPNRVWSVIMSFMTSLRLNLLRDWYLKTRDQGGSRTPLPTSASEKFWIHYWYLSIAVKNLFTKATTFTLIFRSFLVMNISTSNIFTTRKHSSRMRTARFLTVGASVATWT